VQTVGPTTKQFSITLSTLGCHFVSVRAIDSAGNVEPLNSGKNAFFKVFPTGACPFSAYGPVANR
jgi:hypothetical protein